MPNLTRLVIASFFIVIIFCSVQYERGDAAGNHPLIVFNEKGISQGDISIVLKNMGSDHEPRVVKLQDAKESKLISSGELNYPSSVIVSSKLPYRPLHILEYLEAGGSLIWALDQTDSDADTLLKHFGLRSVGLVSDSVNTVNGTHISSRNVPLEHSLNKYLNQAVKYKGIGFKIIQEKSQQNDLVRPFLHAEESAKCDMGLLGDQIVLGATIDTRNGGRILIIGSIESITDSVNNDQFIKTITMWIQKKISYISLVSFDHYQNDRENSNSYVVKTEFDVVACLNEFGTDGKMKSYLPEDVQVELVMQHPRERVTLTPNSTDQCLHGHFQVPDVYGRYTLRLDYSRPGLPIINTKKMISARPPWLDQIPRVAFAALPYYVGWQLQLSITCIFLIPVLWSKVKMNK